MARCISCGASVGCGCQLTNGLCINCINKKNDINQKAKSDIQANVELIKESLDNSIKIYVDLDGQLVTT